jgi:hypothetical protein
MLFQLANILIIYYIDLIDTKTAYSFPATAAPVAPATPSFTPVISHDIHSLL